MSNALAPSKSTVYVSNLPFSLTNSDIHQIFAEHGKLVKVTIMKDKITRKSKGVAFLLYLKREEALNCISAVDGIEMFGRTLKAKMAKDNGRATEFIKRKEYPDKSRCYECGEEGHLSYKCPHNALGERQPPPKKQRVRKKKNEDTTEHFIDTDDDVSDDETLGAAIAYEQTLHNNTAESSINDISRRKKFKRDSYFSDEELSD